MRQKKKDPKKHPKTEKRLKRPDYHRMVGPPPPIVTPKRPENIFFAVSGVFFPVFEIKHDVSFRPNSVSALERWKQLCSCEKLSLLYFAAEIYLPFVFKKSTTDLTCWLHTWSNSSQRACMDMLLHTQNSMLARDRNQAKDFRNVLPLGHFGNSAKSGNHGTCWAFGSFRMRPWADCVHLSENLTICFPEPGGRFYLSGSRRHCGHSCFEQDSSRKYRTC